MYLWIPPPNHCINTHWQRWTSTLQTLHRRRPLDRTSHPATHWWVGLPHVCQCCLHSVRLYLSIQIPVHRPWLHSILTEPNTTQCSQQAKRLCQRLVPFHTWGCLVNLGFHITSKTPSVACLPVHLLGENIPQFSGGQTSTQSSTSLLIWYFHQPPDTSFNNMLYCQYFKANMLYKWDPTTLLCSDKHPKQVITGCIWQKVCPRHIGCKVTRAHIVSPAAGELFYLCCLLMCQPAHSFAKVCTIDRITFDIYQEAAIWLGLFHQEMRKVLFMACTSPKS